MKNCKRKTRFIDKDPSSSSISVQAPTRTRTRKPVARLSLVNYIQKFLGDSKSSYTSKTLFPIVFHLEAQQLDCLAHVVCRLPPVFPPHAVFRPLLSVIFRRTRWQDKMKSQKLGSRGKQRSRTANLIPIACVTVLVQVSVSFSIAFFLMTPLYLVSHIAALDIDQEFLPMFSVKQHDCQENL